MELKTVHNPSASPRDGLHPAMHDAETLRLLLQEERERSNRSGGQFSFLLFDLKNLRSGHSDRTRFVRDISSRVRAIDRVGWMTGDEIGVILPYTPAAGARALAEQALERLGLGPRAITYTIYTYPFAMYEG